MTKLHTKWVSRRERDIWCVDFSGYGNDAAGLRREIDFAEAVIRGGPPDSLLVAVDLNQTKIAAEILAFFNRISQSHSIHKLAVLGVSRPRRFWCERVQHVTWPKPVRFLNDYEQAKDWLVGELH